MSLPLEALLEGKYEILDKIGEGGIGSIYKVRHQLLDEIRVVKVLRAQVAGREDLQERLMKEAKTAIRLTHPNIARLHDLALAQDGTAYIVMEYIDGVSLDSLLAATGPPSLDLSLEIAGQGLRAIGYLHDAGFIHRDISPDNLMLTRDFRGRVKVKLIDLGIAKDVTQKSGVTAEGTFLGKVKYSPPELFRDRAGATRLDQRSDNYSFGVTLYELLTGTYPFSGESFEELAAAHLFHAPRGFEETDPDGRVPEALRAIVLRSLDKDPEVRPASAEEFVELLSAFEIRRERLPAELERTVDATARFLSKFETYRQGSTQAHLNAQFGVERTSAVGAESPDAGPDAPEGDSLRAVPAEAAGPARRRRWLAVAPILVMLLAAGGAAAWLLSRGVEGRDAAGASREALPIELADRWDPGAVTDVVNVPLASAEESPSAGAGDAGGPAADVSSGEDPPADVDGAADPTATVGAGESSASLTVPKLLEAGPGVVEPRLLDVLEPTYPSSKREVIVVISALVGADGRVLAATVKEAPAFKRRFREAALAAVNAASFEPARENGVPGKMWVEVDVRFPPEE